MGKHEVGYPRVDRDHYPTPHWPVAALAEHVHLRGCLVWEPAAGNGSLTRALLGLGAGVFSSDIVDYGFPLHAVHDFTLVGEPAHLGLYDFIITNPPFGPRGKLAEAFIAAGLARLRPGRALCLLLPADFDSAKTRGHLFAGCSDFAAKITLTRRITWFERTDGKRAAPKENSSWYVWTRPLLLRASSPFTLYAPCPRPPAILEQEPMA
jgi:hypothetical protein